MARFIPGRDALSPIIDIWICVEPGCRFRYYYDEFIKWAEENCEYGWCSRGYTCKIFFENEADKIKFLFRFGSEIQKWPEPLTQEEIDSL